jgi:hypothetical protein
MTNRGFADEQPFGDLGVGEPFAHQAEHLLLALAEQPAVTRAGPALDAEPAQHEGDASYDEAREKARLSRGVLMWKLDAAWKIRSWQASRALRDLNASVYDARTRETASGRAREGAPERNAALGARVATLAPRVDGLIARVGAAKDAQARRLADIAVRELEDQRKRLDEYSIQARYALATIYDRAAAAPAASPREPTP